MKTKIPKAIWIVRHTEGFKVYSDSGTEILNVASDLQVQDILTLIQQGESPKRSILAEDYEYDRLKCLHGSDALGFDVYACVHKMDRCLYSVKMMPFTGEREREVKALVRAQHANVVRYYNAWTEESESEKDLCICTELCEKNLQDLVTTSKFKTSEDVYCFFRLLVEAVYHFHKKGIVHRALAPSNIFIDKDGIPKIAEFGRAAIVKDMEDEILWEDLAFEDLEADYRAPELAWGHPMSFITQKVDIFSLGLILFELLYSSQISAEERGPIFAGIRKKCFPSFMHSKGLSRLLHRLLAVDPKTRPNAKQALDLLDLFAEASDT